MPGSTFIFDECRIRHTVDALRAPVLSSMRPAHLPPIAGSAGPEAPGAEAKSDRLCPQTRSTGQSPTQPAPLHRTFGLTSNPHLSLRFAKHESRAGHRRHDTGQRRIEHLNPNGFRNSIRSRLSSLDVPVTPAKSGAGRFPGRGRIRDCPDAKRKRRPNGGPDGGATLHGTPGDSPPPSPAVIWTEIEKKAPCTTRESAGARARSSPFRVWILRRTGPM